MHRFLFHTLPSDLSWWHLWSCWGRKREAMMTLFWRQTPFRCRFKSLITESWRLILLTASAHPYIVVPLIVVFIELMRSIHVPRWEKVDCRQHTVQATSLPDRNCPSHSQHAVCYLLIPLLSVWEKKSETDAWGGKYKDTCPVISASAGRIRSKQSMWTQKMKCLCSPKDCCTVHHVIILRL